MSNEKLKGNCRECNYNITLEGHIACLMQEGYVGIEKIKDNMSHHNCDDFKPLPSPPEKD